jgi:hypothetical protein
VNVQELEFFQFLHALLQPFILASHLLRERQLRSLRVAFLHVGQKLVADRRDALPERKTFGVFDALADEFLHVLLGDFLH